MAYRRTVQLLILCPLLVTMSCAQTAPSQPAPSTRPGPDKENQHPGMPTIKLTVTMRSPEEAYLEVQFTAKSTDAENDKVAYTFAWFRNGVAMEFAATTTNTVSKLGPDTNFDPFAVNTTDITWKVIVKPLDAYGFGATAATSTKITLTRGCEPFPPGYILVDCKGAYVFSSPLTDAVSVAPNARALAIQNVIAQHILGADGTPGHSRFRNFTDLLLKRAFSSPPLLPITFDPDTYQYVGNFADSSALLVLNKVCLDIPLVGNVCMKIFLNDVDNEPGDQLMDFGPVADSRIHPWSAPVTEASPAENGAIAINGLGGNLFEVTIQLKRVQIDLLMEPPTDPILHDIANSSPNYTPENDLSTYLKSYGHAQMGTAYELIFWVDVPTTFENLRFVLRTFRAVGDDFQFVFIRGPYCNNNLGTTETPIAGASYRLDPLERPFDNFGTPFYPGLISDTTSGEQGSSAILELYSIDDWIYPHTTSSLRGGSGVGRDRTGVNSPPYAFDILNGVFSDNPNNCARPADACTVAGIQDGSVEWNGVSASCEYPNKSNNSDDATYKISEQITSIIPYIQGELKANFNHKYILP